MPADPPPVAPLAPAAPPATVVDPAAAAWMRPVRRPRPWISHFGGDTPWILVIAALVVWTSVSAESGQSVSATTPVLLGALVAAAIVGTLAALRGRFAVRPWGALVLVLAAAVALWTGLSIGWSVAPDVSWLEANRTLTAMAVLAAGAAAAWWVPFRWPAALGGVLLGTTVITVLALLSKVFPGALDPDQLFARLQQPLGYWNAVGVIAAFTFVLSLWLGTRRDGYRPLNAMAYPVGALAVVVLLLTYSRGSLLAALVGTVVWFAFSSRRLHSLLVLAVTVLGGGFIGIWAFANNALSTDNVLLAARESSGTQLGVLLLAAVVLLALIGLAIEFATIFAGIRSTDRRQVGLVVLALVALIPIAGVGMLATSERGLGGSISNAWEKLTVPTELATTGDASRLTSVGSQRSLYWQQAFRVYREAPTRGVGAGGFGPVQARAREESDVPVEHAHGWVPQTLADLGRVGLLLQLLLGLAWLAVAGRAIGLYGPLRGGTRAPRDGAVAAVAVVAVFAVASVVDWVWFIPGVTLPVMLLAGWIVGRGSREPETAEPTIGRRPIPWRSPRSAVAVATLAVAIAALFSVAQPLRSEHARQAALEALDAGDPATAEAKAAEARRINPLSEDAIYAAAQVEVVRGRIPAARALFEQAVAMQPAVPLSWQRLAEFELTAANDPKRAQLAAGVALKMAPTLRSARLTAVAANRELAAAQTAAAEDPAAPADDG